MKNYIGAISAIALTVALGAAPFAAADPCSNSASPFCANSSLPREMAPLSPAPEVCKELYSYTKADHQPGELVSVPERLIAPARAAGCDIPDGIA